MTPARIDLSSIDLPAMSLVVERIVHRNGQDHSRWVFLSRSSAEPLYYKVWNPGYVRRDNLLMGLESGLYTPATVPALKAVIMSGNQCRGYVMAAGRRQRRPTPALVHALWAATQVSGYFAAQYRPTHTIVANGCPSLIDLEAVHAIAGEPGWPVGKVAIEDPDYAALIHRLQAGPVSQAEVRSMADRHVIDYAGAKDRASFPRRKLIGAKLRLIRATKRGFGDRRDLIEKF